MLPLTPSAEGQRQRQQQQCPRRDVSNNSSYSTPFGIRKDSTMPSAIEEAISTTSFHQQHSKHVSSGYTSKLNGMLQNFYSRTAHIIVESRQSIKSDRINKWFYLATPDMISLRGELRFWQSKATYPCKEPPSPLTIHIYLDTTYLTRDQVYALMTDYIPHHNRYQLYHSQRKKIVLESWTLICRPSSSSSYQYSISADLPSLYKRFISFFRALHSLTRLLPGNTLREKLRTENKYVLGYRIATEDASISSSLYLPDELPLDWSLINGCHGPRSDTYEFCDIATPIGSFQLKVHYRTRNTLDDDLDMDIKENIYASPATTSEEYNRHYRNQQHQQQQFTIFRSQSSPLLSQHQNHHIGLPILNKERQQMLKNKDIPSAVTHRPDSFIYANDVSKHISVPSISPFKSPLLSSVSSLISRSVPDRLPKVEKSKSSVIISTSNPNRDTSAQKGEFIPSFNHFKTKKCTSRKNTLDESSQPYFDGVSISTEVDNNLEDFMRLINAKPNLKVFNCKQSTQSKRLPEDIIGSDSASAFLCTVPSSTLTTTDNDIFQRSKMSLRRFHTLQHDHSDLSESMASTLTTTHCSSQPPSTSSVQSTSSASLQLSSAAMSSIYQYYHTSSPSSVSASSSSFSGNCRSDKPANEDAVAAADNGGCKQARRAPLQHNQRSSSAAMKASTSLSTMGTVIEE